MKFVGIFTLFLLMIAQPGSARAQNVSVNLSQEEYQFYTMINKFRAQLGLPTLQIHLYIQNAAKKHSEWMASQDFLSHYGPINNKTPFERMQEEGYTNYTRMGENVACGNGDAVKTFRQWAFSPGHLANMVSPHFHHMGIARAGTGNENCPYFWTNDFGSITDPRLDPAAITDVQKISAAIEAVAGKIPEDKKVQLPMEQTQTSNQNNSSSEVPATTNDAPESEFSLIQCMIPYVNAKNTLSFTNNLDALMELTPNDFGSYKAKVSYLSNGAATNFAPLYIANVTVSKSPYYPLVLIFGMSTTRNGFLIQFDTTKSSAQYDPHPSSSGTAGSILCSYKI